MKVAKLISLGIILVICSCKSNLSVNKKNVLCDCKDWQAKADKEFNTISNNKETLKNEITLKKVPNNNVEKRVMRRKTFKRTRAHYVKSKGKNKKKFEKIIKCFQF